jgi:quercetin dioxygenase-like cupin family protein
MTSYHNRFETFSTYFGKLADDGEGTVVFGFETQSEVHAHRAGERVVLDSALGAVFGFVHSGEVESTFAGRPVTFSAGTYFTTPAGASLTLGAGARVACFQREGFRAYETVGVVEKSGRLRYIDGCWDSVLVSPPRMGDACLNALWVPQGVHQTMHTHPSTRAGVLVRADGQCDTDDGAHPLQDGMIFFLPKDVRHKFRTDLGQAQGISLVAYHPDSDTGPSDDEHPMLNRTMVDATSAKDLSAIRTK